MAKKLITAQNILHQKGFQVNKLDTEGLNDVIANYFIKNDVQATLYLVPMRFVEMHNTPSCGYIDITDVTILKKKLKDPNDPLFSDGWFDSVFLERFSPRIIIDEPFIKNVAHMLALMGGYVVKEKGRGRFLVSLV